MLQIQLHIRKCSFSISSVCFAR